MKKIIVVLLIILSPCLCWGDSFFSQFIDPDDGALDISNWLGRQTGFLPVPLLITEPAVGYGAGAALLFFHGNDDAEVEESDIPPSISVAVGAYTESDSWLAGGGHLGTWKKDNIRYTGFAGLASLNLSFYGVDQESDLNDNGQDFNIEGEFLLQEIKFRINDSPLFIGGRFSYMNSESEFDLIGIPGIPSDQLKFTSVGAGILFNYDSRDNILTPNTGHNAKLEYINYNTALGSSEDYHRINAVSLSYWQVHPKVVLGVRIDGAGAAGETPFYDLPYIELRGIPALRYQDETVLVGELEARWDMTYRWSLVGFMGSGWAAGSVNDLGNATARAAGGVGIRYFIAKALGIRSGIDIARGPEDTVIYLQVGSAW